jgi:hypothetical protein
MAAAPPRRWFEAGSIVPLRIDYQPRSFLRLSFVRDAQAGLPRPRDAKAGPPRPLLK